MRKPQNKEITRIREMIMKQSSKPIFDHMGELRGICDAYGTVRMPDLIFEIFLYGIICGKKSERERRKKGAAV